MKRQTNSLNKISLNDLQDARSATSDRILRGALDYVITRRIGVTKPTDNVGLLQHSAEWLRDAIDEEFPRCADDVLLATLSEVSRISNEHLTRLRAIAKAKV